MIEITNYADIVKFVETLPGSYPDISVKKYQFKYAPTDRKTEIIMSAKEVNYIFNKWNVSKTDRQKIIELIIAIKALEE